MKGLPFVSIIIPSFNGRDYLDGCLDSISGLDYPKDNIEIVIIVDGAPKDKANNCVKHKFSDIKIIQHKTNQGAAQARNTGIKNSRGQLLAFLDNDIEVEKNWLLELVKVIGNDEQVGICVSKLLFRTSPHIVNSAGGIMNIYGDAWDRGVFEKDTGQYETIEQVFFGCSAAMLTRRSTVESIGYFDSRYFYLYEDVDLGWRMNLAGYKVMYIPKAVAYHRLAGRLRWDANKMKYFIERNRIRTVLKNYEYRTMFKYFFQFSQFRFSKFIQELKSTKERKPLLLIYAFLAWLWNFINFLDILNKRKYVQRTRKVPDQDIIKLLGNFKDRIFEHESSHRS